MRSVRRLAVEQSCEQDWGAMAMRAGGARRCEACAHDVLDLTRMTRRQADAAVARATAAHGRACGRMVVDGAGDAVFAVEPARVPGLVLAAAITAGAIAGCSGASDQSPGVLHPVADPAATLVAMGPPVLPAPPAPPAPPPVEMTAMQVAEAEVAPERTRHKHPPSPPTHIRMGVIRRY